MPQLKKVLVTTDFSELSKAGVRYGLEVAASWKAEGVVLHVADYREALSGPGSDADAPTRSHYESIPQFVEERKQAMDEFLKGNFPDLLESVKVEEVVTVGTPHEEIVAQAEKLGVDLIVMSTHGRTGLGHVFVGSVTEQVVRRAHCPVLSVKHDFIEKVSA